MSSCATIAVDWWSNFAKIGEVASLAVALPNGKTYPKKKSISKWQKPVEML